MVKKYSATPTLLREQILEKAQEMITKEVDDKIYEALAGNKLKCKCGHKWLPRVKKPLKCPRCQRFLKVLKGGKDGKKNVKKNW